MTDTQRKSLREDIAEVLNDDNGYSRAVQTWAATARDLLGNLDAAEARIKAVQDVLDRYKADGLNPYALDGDIRRTLDN